MKKYKYVFTTFLIVISFYLTDRIMLFIQSKNPIMIVLNEKKDDYFVNPVNAYIEGDKIIPGISGKKVNLQKSFLNMEEFGKFNEIYIKFDKIIPDISLNDNLDKIIVKGNTNKKQVALIINNNLEVKEYLNSKAINYTEVIYLNEDLKKENDYINGENDKNKFADLNTLIKKNKNKKICLYNISNLDECFNKKYYIVNYSIYAGGGTIDVLNKINSGEIIYVDSYVSLDNVKLIINEIKKLDLSIVSVGTLISE